MGLIGIIKQHYRNKELTKLFKMEKDFAVLNEFLTLFVNQGFAEEIHSERKRIKDGHNVILQEAFPTFKERDDLAQAKRFCVDLWVVMYKGGDLVPHKVYLGPVRHQGLGVYKYSDCIDLSGQNPSEKYDPARIGDILFEYLEKSAAICSENVRLGIWSGDQSDQKQFLLYNKVYEISLSRPDLFTKEKLVLMKRDVEDFKLPAFTKK